MWFFVFIELSFIRLGFAFGLIIKFWVIKYLKLPLDTTVNVDSVGIL